MSNFYNKKAVSGAPVDMEDNGRIITVYYSAFGNVDSDDSHHLSRRAKFNPSCFGGH